MGKNMESPIIYVAVTTFAAVLGVGFLFWRQKKSQKKPVEKMVIPTKWTKVGEVGDLILYPLKGGKRKCLTEAECSRRGLREVESGSAKILLQDRVFMVFDDKNKIYNMKRNTKVLFVETTAVDECRVKFSYPGADDLIIQLPDKKTTPNQVDFYYGEKVDTVDCGEEAATWFSRVFLNKQMGLRLSCFIASLVSPRSIDGSFKDVKEVYTKLHSDYLGAYADIASYMLMGQESVNDLNNRLFKPVTEHNFRPNIVVKGSPAYSEDSWDWVKIGENVVLRSFKYCVRCIVTSVDADTGVRDPTTEPLRTLKSYRLVEEPHLKKLEGSSPKMGLYLGCHQSGIVHVGDPVYVNAE